MELEVLPQDFSICKVAALPEELCRRPFCFAARTDRECSLVCPTGEAPAEPVARSDGWRAFRVRGCLDFSLVGILADLSQRLAAQRIGLFAISTYDTDYILTQRA